MTGNHHVATTIVIINLNQDHQWMPESEGENLLGVLKRINIVGLRLLSLERPAWPLAGIWELGLQEGSHHSQNG